VLRAPREPIKTVTVRVEDARRLLVDATGTDADRAAGARAFLDRVWPDVIDLCSVDPSARTALADLREAVATLGEEHEERTGSGSSSASSTTHPSSRSNPTHTLGSSVG
jgi:hypothetical protein